MTPGSGFGGQIGAIDKVPESRCTHFKVKYLDLRALCEAGHVEDLQQWERKIWEDEHIGNLERTDFPHVVSNLSTSCGETSVALDQSVVLLRTEIWLWAVVGRDLLRAHDLQRA